MQTSNITDVLGTDWLNKVDEMLEEYRPIRQILSTPSMRRGKSMSAALASAIPMRKELNTVTSQVAAANGMQKADVLKAMAQAIQTMNSAVVGKEALTYWLDEYDPLSQSKKLTSGPAATFDDPKFEGSRVEVWRVELSGRDPRNPNPQAGSIVTYEVRCEQRVTERVSGLESAKTRASELHKELIEEITANFLERNPRFGLF